MAEETVDRVLSASERFRPVLIGARYHADTDRVELTMSWCTLLVDRRQIVELRDVSLHDLDTISVSAVGLHIERADIDINAGGLLTALAKKIGKQAAKSV